MVEIGTIRADIRFDPGSLERLFADLGAAVADAQRFQEREEPMRRAFVFPSRDEGATGLSETRRGRDAPSGRASA